MQDVDIFFPNGVLLGTAHELEDGFFVFQSSQRSGYWSSHSLRYVADKLEGLNQEHMERIMGLKAQDASRTAPESPFE